MEVLLCYLQNLLTLVTVSLLSMVLLLLAMAYVGLAKKDVILNLFD